MDNSIWEWDIIYNGVHIGRTTTDKRHELIMQAIKDGKIKKDYGAGEIEFSLVPESVTNT